MNNLHHRRRSLTMLLVSRERRIKIHNINMMGMVARLNLNRAKINNHTWELSLLHLTITRLTILRISNNVMHISNTMELLIVSNKICKTRKPAPHNSDQEAG